MLITSTHATKRITLSAILFSALAAPSLQAAVVTQTQNFSFSYSGPSTFNGPVTNVIAPAGSFFLNANPFNSTLGTLDSFTIEWSLSHDTSFSSGNTSGVSLSAQTIGSTVFFLSNSSTNISYAGQGGGNGNGSGPNSLPLTANYTLGNNSTFLVSNAGISYNPMLLSIVTGSSPFTVNWGGGMQLGGFGDFATLVSTVTGSATLTYNYTAVATPVPEPTESMLFGIGLLALASSVRRRWH